MHLREEPLDGSLYVFTNRRRTGLKMLMWTHGGFVMLYKSTSSPTHLPWTNPKNRRPHFFTHPLVPRLDAVNAGGVVGREFWRRHSPRGCPAVHPSGRTRAGLVQRTAPSRRSREGTAPRRAIGAPVAGLRTSPHPMRRCRRRLPVGRGGRLGQLGGVVGRQEHRARLRQGSAAGFGEVVLGVEAQIDG
ncbi:MAG: hypothetical protein D6717_12265 [Gammaproteobacteria bacterium]|nr:MAG: hypothetical protein D6717_12265 [Gammaproteobacteria bacterium]